MRPRILVAVATVLWLWAAVVFFTGGFHFAADGLRLSSRDWTRPLLAGTLVGALAWWRYGGAAVRAELGRLHLWVLRWPWIPVTIMAAAVLISGLLLSAKVAGSADAYGYVSQAQLWKQGRLHIDVPLATRVPWPDRDWTLSPLGYRPSRTPGVIVPTYAPGLPVLMALFSLVREGAEYWVVPLCGALTVVLSFVLGRRLHGSGVGVLTAALMASSPAFLFFLMWPMSDVPVAAFWVGSLALLALADRSWLWFGAGLTSSLAIFIRPNTAPVAAALFVAFAIHGRGDRTWRLRRYTNAALYAAGAVPGCVAVAVIHTHLYGSPLRSGYGPVTGLYQFANAPVNAASHLNWLVTSETLFIGLALVGLLSGWRSPHSRALTLRMALYALTVWLCYAFYGRFQEWWYLRFLLSGFPVLLAFTAAGFAHSIAWLSPPYRTVAAMAIVPVVLVMRLGYAHDEGAFGMWKGERRYVQTAEYVKAELPRNAIFICMQQSGSLRYYADRLTVRWDLLDPEWLDEAIESLAGLGYRPYVLLEEGEEADFRGRFGVHSADGLLNWPAHATLWTVPVVRIYDPQDRSR